MAPRSTGSTKLCQPYIRSTALRSTPGYSNYTNAFNDVAIGGNTNPSTVSAAPGYDIVTGLGSPHVPQIIRTLNSAAAGTFTPQVLLPSPITAVFPKAPPISVVGGTTGSINLRLLTSSGLRFNGAISITLSASSDYSVSSDDTTLETLALRPGAFPASGTRTVSLHFTYPTNFEGTSADLIASISTTAIATQPSTATAPGAVVIEVPTVDLSPTYTAKNAVLVRPGKHASVSVKIQNLGNVAAIGTLSVNLNPSTDGIADFSTLLASILNRKIRIAPGKSIVLTLGLLDPAADIGGAYSN